MKILKIDGSTEELNDNSLEAMQEAVGGYIEIVPTKDGRILIIDEEGKLKGKPRNVEATKLAHLFSGDCIVGDAILADDDEVQ